MPVSARHASLIAAAALGLAAGLYGLSRGLREPPPSPSQEPADAAALYARYCAVCHGPAGKGDGPGTRVTRQAMRDFSDPAAMREVDDRYYVAIIQKGGSQLGRSNAMPAWGMKLSDDEIRALVRYIRGLARTTRNFHRGGVESAEAADSGLSRRFSPERSVQASQGRIP